MISSLSALVIVKPLPRETHLLHRKDLGLVITVYASITNADELNLSLGHSLRGLYEDITNYLLYKISEEKDVVNENNDGKTWKIDMTLSYPFSGDLGNLILSIGDSHSGGITTTRLVIGEEKELLVKPFFDPIPEDVIEVPGHDVMINSRAKGSTPIKVTFVPLHYCVLK